MPQISPTINARRLPAGVSAEEAAQRFDQQKLVPLWELIRPSIPSTDHRGCSVDLSIFRHLASNPSLRRTFFSSFCFSPNLVPV
jgi:hypothetical protein